MLDLISSLQTLLRFQKLRTFCLILLLFLQRDRHVLNCLVSASCENTGSPTKQTQNQVHEDGFTGQVTGWDQSLKRNLHTERPFLRTGPLHARSTGQQQHTNRATFKKNCMLRQIFGSRHTIESEKQKQKQTSVLKLRRGGEESTIAQGPQVIRPFTSFTTPQQSANHGVCQRNALACMSSAC